MRFLRLFSLLLTGLAAFAADPVTIIFVRHAEKATTDTDTPLSDKGHARAKALAEALRDVPLTKIYTSEKIRTKQTAAPTAAAKGITPDEVIEVPALADKLRASAPGSFTLVVHHGGTVPALVAKLGGGTLTPIEEPEFDRMVILTLPSSHVTTLRYGGR